MDKIASAAAHTFAYAMWPVAAGGAVAWWITLTPFMKEIRYV